MQPFPQQDPQLAAHADAVAAQLPGSSMPEYTYRMAIIATVLLLLWSAL